MTGIGAMGEKAEAQSVKGGKTKIEQQRKLEGTESSAWSTRIVREAQADIARVKTKDDAEWLVRTHLNAMVREFYFPTQGDISENKVYGMDLKTRKYAKDDGEIILQNIRAMRDIIHQLNSQWGVEAVEERENQLADMEAKVKTQASYIGEKQQEMLKGVEKKPQ